MEDARVDKHRWWEVKKKNRDLDNILTTTKQDQSKCNPNKKNTDIKKKMESFNAS